MATAHATTWVLTGSPENLAATRQHGFGVIGLKEGRRRQAEALAAGDQVVFYVTRVQAFAALARVTGSMFEDRTPIWPGKPGKADPYPWRVPAEPVLVLDDDELVPAETVALELEHVRKWPREHWRLAFQGQLRTVSAHDARVLLDALAARAGLSAPA